MGGERGILGEERLGLAPGLHEQRAVAGQIAEAKLGQPGLAEAEDLARASNQEIGLGDAEPVAGLLEDAETLARLRGAGVLR